MGALQTGPTSAVDAGTEMAIMEALCCLIAGRTSFVITHRLNTIRHCDLIVRIEDGRLVGIGPEFAAAFPVMPVTGESAQI